MNDIVKKLVNKFRETKGKMSFYCFDKNTEEKFVHELIKTYTRANNEHKILIVAADYNTRQYYKNLLDGYDEETTCSFTFITEKYINVYYSYHYDLFISIGGVNLNILKLLRRDCKFGCVIIREHINDSNLIMAIRSLFTDAGITVTKDYNLTTPVNGMVHSVCLNTADDKTYREYTEYINDTVKIFGDTDMITKCKIGDENKSAAMYREELANNNGWSSVMDTSIEFYQAIDDMYNPNALFERAVNFYKITEKRRRLLTDNEAKLDKILEIVKSYVDAGEKVLIVSKRDDFAHTVADYLNKNEIACGEYHDSIPDRIATDDYGKPIYVKSGKDKGKVKVIKSQAISTLDEKRFNYNTINVLSIKSSSNNKLNLACNAIIFTTSLLPNILDFKTRFRNVNIIGVPNKIHYIISNTRIEQNGIVDMNKLPFVNIEEQEEKNVSLSENNFDIIL